MPTIRSSRRPRVRAPATRRHGCARGASPANCPGDIITEPNIHTLDVASWIMGRPPLSACGTGGRKFRDAGTCWDTFNVLFQYPDNLRDQLGRILEVAVHHHGGVGGRGRQSGSNRRLMPEVARQVEHREPRIATVLVQHGLQRAVGAPVVDVDHLRVDSSIAICHTSSSRNVVIVAIWPLAETATGIPAVVRRI